MTETHGERENDEVNESETGDPTQSSLVDEMIKIVSKRTETTVSGSDNKKKIWVAKDQQGREYVQLRYEDVPEKSRLASLIMRPVINSAQVIIDTKSSYPDYPSLPIHYSHRIDLNKISNRDGEVGLKTDILLTFFIFIDEDHALEGSEVHNAKIKDRAHYLFDFDLAFSGSSYEDKRDQETGLPEFKKKFDAFFITPEEKEQALKLLRKKINRMISIYKGSEGKKLLSAMVKRCFGKDDNLEEISPKWRQEGSKHLYQFITKRFAMAKEFIETERQSLKIT